MIPSLLWNMNGGGSVCLSAEQRALIVNVVKRCFGYSGRVLLFGSRTRNDAKGGDFAKGEGVNV